MWQFWRQLKTLGSPSWNLLGISLNRSFRNAIAFNGDAETILALCPIQLGTDGGRIIMTLLSRVLAYFPALVMAIALACVVEMFLQPGSLRVVAFLALLLTLYGLPLGVYHIHQRFYPLKEGISYLLGKEYNPWWGSSQIQLIYVAFPILEVILRLIPGAFSLWLRLWGSKVGQQVYWTPTLELLDRGLLEIGDRVIFGHDVGLTSHTIKPKRNDLLLYVRKIKIGNDVFVGARVDLGPGATVADQSYVPLNSVLFAGHEVKTNVSTSDSRIVPGTNASSEAIRASAEAAPTSAAASQNSNSEIPG